MLASIRSTSLLVGSDNSLSTLAIGNVTDIVSSCLFHDTPSSFVSCGLVPELSFAYVESVLSVFSEVSYSGTFECHLCTLNPPALKIVMAFSL